MNKPIILYRKGMNPDDDEIELSAISGLFHLTHLRTEIPKDSLVIGRMSVLPFYKELELDLNNNGSSLINTYRQHQFIADMREWCEVLGDLTPKLYERLQDLPEKGPFVLKGQTNSLKQLWSTHMYAEDKRAAGEVYCRLKQDYLINTQEVYTRNYEPLVKLSTGLNGLPITLEFRFFICNGQVICGGYYWASHVADLAQVPHWSMVPESFLRECITCIGDKAAFYTLDVAKTEAGNWIVIEINDGQMSGLSCCNPEELYGNLKAVLEGLN